MQSSSNHGVKSADYDQSYDVVIVGSGLAGLMTAVKASSQHKKVLVIESRQEKHSALRPQLISLTKYTLKQLCDMPLPANANLSPEEKFKDLRFLDTLKNKKNEHYQIKDIQRFLKHRIDPEFCTMAYESNVIAVNTYRGHVVLSQSDKHQKEIQFQHLVLAEGAKREVASLIPHIEYQLLEGRPERNHVQGYFTVQSKNKKPIEALFKPALALLVNGEYCGYIYYEQEKPEETNNSKVKLSIVMHVPDELFEKYSLDKSLGISYLKHCVASIFSEDKHDIYITKSRKWKDEKDKLKYSTFTLDFKEVKTPAFDLHERTYIVEGDGKRNPDFYAGHGGNDALEDGIWAGFVIDKKMTLDQYNVLSQERSKDRSRSTAKDQPIKTSRIGEMQTFDVLPFPQDKLQESESKQENKPSSRNLYYAPLEEIEDNITKNILPVLSSEAFQVLRDSRDGIIKWEGQIRNEIQESLDSKLAFYMEDFRNYILSAEELPKSYFNFDITRIHYLASALNDSETIEKIQSEAKKSITKSLGKITDSVNRDIYLASLHFKQVLYYSIQFDLVDTYKNEILEKATQLFDVMTSTNDFRAFLLVTRFLKHSGLLEGEMLTKCKEVADKIEQRTQEQINSPGWDTSFRDYVSHIKNEINEMMDPKNETSSENTVTIHRPK